MVKRLRSESGMGFIAAIIAVAVMILGFIGVSTKYFVNLAHDGRRARLVLAAFEVSQNLAAEARRGYDAYRTGNGACTAPATARTIRGVQYCLPAQACVNNPIGGVGTTQVCWNTASANGDVNVALAPERFPGERWLVAKWNRARYITGEKVIDLGMYLAKQLGNEALAQVAGMDAFMPALPGAPGPAVSLGALACTGADRVHCQRCQDNTASVTGQIPACVLFRICLTEDDCAGTRDTNRIRQWIALVR